MSLSVSKAYNIPLERVLDMYYSDMTVLYAKEANNKAFESYSSYISMSEEARSSYVMDYGEPKPFMFSVVTKEMQQKLLEEEEKDDNGLRAMYKKRKGNLSDMMEVLENAMVAIILHYVSFIKSMCHTL